MKALVFHGPNDLRVEEAPGQKAGPGEALVKVTLATICGTDVHIMTGGYPVKPGLIIGHEFVGVIEELGEGITGYEVGGRVAVGAITPCGRCNWCLAGDWAQCGGIPLGGWKFGNYLNGSQAEYIVIPDAQGNMAKIPDELTDEQVLFVGDIMSTGFSASDTANVKPGDAVAVFGQGPIGICAMLGARIRGACPIITVEPLEYRREMSLRMGADYSLDPNTEDVQVRIKEITNGRGADVAIEALGEQVTFDGCLKAVKPAGVVSSLGVYEEGPHIDLAAWGAGIADIDIMTTLCPGGKERLRRLIQIIQYKRVDLTPLITHRFPLDDILEGYRIFSQKLDNVYKVAITP